jgi:hypothetical protein
VKACRSGVARWRRELGRLRECDKQLARISIHVAALVLALWIGLPAASLAQKPAPSLEELTRASHIIFVGRVEKLYAANLKVVKPTETTVLVRVEELLDVPPSLVGLKGEDVTVELAQPRELKPEQRAVFFTNGILFGEHLEVKEVGLLPAPSDRAKMRSEIAAVRGRTKDEAVQARLKSSVLVVTGKVLRIMPVAQTGPRSEHEPNWAQALIAVQSVEKGSLKEKSLTVYFPQSTDERWLLSPKFHTGQQGVWILHPEGKFGLPQAAFTALNPADFYPLVEQQRIRRLLH